jgi:hypothetical protein
MQPFRGVSSYTVNLSLCKSLCTLLYPKLTDWQRFVQRLHAKSISRSEEKRRLRKGGQIRSSLLCVHLRIFLITNHKTAWEMVTDVQNGYGCTKWLRMYKMFTDVQNGYGCTKWLRMYKIYRNRRVYSNKLKVIRILYQDYTFLDAAMLLRT